MADKIEPSYPKSSAAVSLKVDGIYNFPDEWRTTDQANPGMFTYVVKFCNADLTGGKVYARELTEKQLREQEEAKKKGGKKQAKKEENPAEAEKLREQQQKQEAEQRKRQEAWSKMTEQQRIYAASEDKHKNAQLRFENNIVQKQYKDNLFVIFEEHVLKDGGEWVYIFKLLTANQQQLEKLKKSKPKNLNINDLNPVSMRAWVDLTALRSSEQKQCVLRCKIQQVDALQQTPKPNLQKAYIKLSVTLSQPLLAAADSYSTSTLIRDPPQPSPVPLSKKCVQEMHEQLRLAIESLAMQYSNMFWKQLNANEEQKAAAIFVTNKKNQHVKRKQQFLYDFNVSGKYKVLKERLKKIIVHLCEHKFTDKMQGAKSFTGITCSVRDQFYSQIYNYLVTFYSETMQQLIAQKKQKLQQVFVLNSQTHNYLTQQVLQQYRKQTKQQRFSRIISEYNAVGNFEYGQNMYKTDIARNPQNTALKYQYSMFCIRNGFNTVSEVLGWGFIEQYLQSNKNDDNVRVQYVLLMIGSENTKLLKKAWVILRQIISEHPSENVYLLYASLLADLLGKLQCASKYSFLAYRQQLRKEGKIKDEGKHRIEPNTSEIPSLTTVASYNVQLKAEQKDKLWIEVIENFSQLGLFNIIEKLKQRLSSQQIPSLLKQNVKILFFQQQYKQCKEKAIQLYNTSKDYQLLQIILRCCQNLGDNEEREKYLKISLQSATADKKKEVLLALGQFYIGVGKYGNAKACLVKYLEGNSTAGGLSWQILGIAELKCGNYDAAIQCLRHSNLSDPYNKQVWIWLAQAYSKLNNFVMVNQCLNCYMDSISTNQQAKIRLKQVKQSVQAAKTANFYDNSMKQRLLARLQCY